MGLKLVIAKDANAVGKKVASEIINLLKEKKELLLKMLMLLVKKLHLKSLIF